MKRKIAQKNCVQITNDLTSNLSYSTLIIGMHVCTITGKTNSRQQAIHNQLLNILKRICIRNTQQLIKRKNVQENAQQKVIHNQI